jgi:hydrogenase nickel insertion protein HypA
MHEASLARQLLKVTLEVADRRGARKVAAVRGWIAESEPLAAESIEAHFRACASGTLADGARLELRLEHVSARCRQCGDVFLPLGHLLLCPKCGSGEAELTGRTGLGIDELEIAD